MIVSPLATTTVSSTTTWTDYSLVALFIKIFLAGCPLRCMGQLCIFIWDIDLERPNAIAPFVIQWMDRIIV